MNRLNELTIIDLVGLANEATHPLKSRLRLTKAVRYTSFC